MKIGKRYFDLAVDGIRMDESLSRYRPAVAIACGLAVILYYFRFIGHPGGMAIFPMAGACLLRGELLVRCAPGFMYPPFFAFLMIPFAFLPMWARNLAWYAVLIGATYGSFRICEALTVKAFDLKTRELIWLRVFALALSLKFILAVFENQAYDVLVFFFVLLGIYGLSESKSLLASSGLAVAIALKWTPVLLLLYALFLRKWKIFALGVGLCAFLSLLPDLFFPASDPRAGYLHRWIMEVAGGGLLGASGEVYPSTWEGGNHLNQSLRPVVHRLVDGSEWSAHFWTILCLTSVAYSVCAVAVIVGAARVEGASVWRFSVVVISMLMLSPISSKSQFVALLLPHMAIVAYLMKHREVWRAAVPLLCGSFVLNTLTAKGLIGRELSNKMLSLGCITIGTLLLLAVVAVIVFQSGKEAGAPEYSRLLKRQKCRKESQVGGTF